MTVKQIMINADVFVTVGLSDDTTSIVLPLLQSFLNKQIKDRNLLILSGNVLVFIDNKFSLCSVFFTLVESKLIVLSDKQKCQSTVV